MRIISLIFLLLSGGLISYGHSNEFNRTMSFNKLRNIFFRLGATMLLIFSLSNTYSQIQPAACSNTVIPVTAAVQNFYDPGGAGGNPCVPDVANNYPNSGCITSYNFVSPVGTTILIDFSVLSLYNTVSGWDWMVVYDGGNNASPILFDNRAGAPDNDGLPVDPNAGCFEENNVSFCSSGNEIFIEFFASGVISREGWEATVTLCNAPCSITNITTNITTCNPGPNAYDLAGSIDFITPPAGGVLTITDCHGNNQIFNPPFISPINYNLTGITADGVACDVTAVFSDDALCTFTANYAAPWPDVFPTATDPLPMDIECFADVLGPDPTVVTDENDNSGLPAVTWEDDTSDGLSCPETILRRYRVTDACGNFIFVTQTITVLDVTAPVFDPQPADVAVQCSTDVPLAADLAWNDNCDGTGMAVATDVSDGASCPEVITRTWTYTDDCGNIATVSQLITVVDTQVPVFDPQPIDVVVQCSSDVPTAEDLAWNDNCDGTGMAVAADVSDGLSCPEKIERTWTYTDACGNIATALQTIIVDDTTDPTASNLSPLSVPGSMDIPPADILDVTDEADNCTVNPIVTIEGVDVSDGNVCNGEIITRTYRVTDECGNFILVTQQITIEAVYPPVSIDDHVICEGSSTTLTADNPMGVPISWDNGVQDGVSFTPTQTTLYTVTADNLGCISTASATVTLEEIPMVDFTADTLSGCEPLTVVFSNLSVAGVNGSLASCVWDIEGASNSISGCTGVSYTFGSGGSYDVTLTTTSETGCINSLTYTDYIYVEDSPLASFTISDNAVSVLNTEVDFTNTSTGAVNYQWTFGDETSGTTDIHPSHVFPNTEANGYTVELIVYSPIGCVDTARLIVMVEEELIFYIPNTFTPDSDAFNNTFQPVFTSGFDPFDFNMLIFNRWGEVIFETNDAEVGWDGTYLAGRGLVQDGMYTWRIEFKQIKNDKRLVKTGQVSIFK